MGAAKRKKETLTEKILNFLSYKTSEAFDLTSKLLFDPKSLFYGESFHFSPKQIYNLKKSPYFKQEGKNFYVTDRGRIKIIKNILNTKKRGKKWNCKWVAVAFDMPEATRRNRDFLRRELKWMGFKEFQHSVWITPHDVEKELTTLLSLWQKDFRGNIQIMKIESITGDKKLKEYFKVT